METVPGDKDCINIEVLGLGVCAAAYCCYSQALSLVLLVLLFLGYYESRLYVFATSYLGR